jgi:hypothetical protein
MEENYCVMTLHRSEFEKAVGRKIDQSELAAILRKLPTALWITIEDVWEDAVREILND